MEKNNLRKEISEETQSLYEAKLREAKRRQAQVEEELESSSERWRAERRKLNAEIDRLESDLSKATLESRKRTAEPRAEKGIDPLEVAKIQSSADEKIRKAAQEWEIERQKLMGEIARQQRAVGELIERTNNPLRAAMPVKDELEGKLTEAIRAKEQVEAAYLREKSAWDEEKLSMTGELVKLRHSHAQSKAPRGKLDSADRAQELEARIAAMQAEMDRERTDWRTQIQQLERRLADNRQTMNSEIVDQLRRQYDDRIQEMILQKTQLTEELKSASNLLEAERGRFTSATGSEDTEAIAAEVARVQSMLAGIGDLIGDPNTELSTVIRKNVERAELDAYLRGIRFFMKQGKAPQ